MYIEPDRFGIEKNSPETNLYMFNQYIARDIWTIMSFATQRLKWTN